ncbi:hypothetical protein J3458_001289 [Metarhizium acridum]|uniref:uncharacterized protein n=1 Tax=Metarhizium acridum TaxID=92637 RepID=UPI001C6A9BE3|nr:hypothetical protein J3458_001289 [Metarhizium acridum]
MPNTATRITKLNKILGLAFGNKLQHYQMATIAPNPSTTTTDTNGVNDVNGAAQTKSDIANLPSPVDQANGADQSHQAKPDAANPSKAPEAANDTDDETDDDNAGQGTCNTKHSQPRDNETWPAPKPKSLQANGSGLKRAIKGKKPPGGFDTTPLPDAPQGYTIRFTFRYAANLPPADFGTASSDPFLTATLTASNPKRHKEDPDLVHRTRTIRKTTEPEWNEEWVVANVPPSGFKLKCRLYDEDAADHDDRLGNVTIQVPRVFEQWEGIPPPG